MLRFKAAGGLDFYATAAQTPDAVWSTVVVGGFDSTGAWTFANITSISASIATFGGDSLENNGNEAITIRTIGTGTSARATLAARSGNTLRWRVGSSVGSGFITGAAANELCIITNSQAISFSTDNGTTNHMRMDTVGVLYSAKHDETRNATQTATMSYVLVTQTTYLLTVQWEGNGAQSGLYLITREAASTQVTTIAAITNVTIAVNGSFQVTAVHSAQNGVFHLNLMKRAAP
jgi:hypothetical protein